MPGKITLTMVEGSEPGKEFTFAEHDLFIVGRAADCHVQLTGDDKKISRHHFLLEVNPPEARLRDLGSRNGTFVNGVKHGGREREEKAHEAAGRVFPEVNISHDDRIRAGRTVLQVRVELPAPPEPALLCLKCGKDARSEVPAGRSGDYLCQACHAAVRNDPGPFLLEMIQRDARNRNAPVPDDVAGYTLLKLLGVGGAGAVYLARHKAGGTLTALKVILARVPVDEESRARFLTEVARLRTVNHPHCVQLFREGSAGPAFFFVMEYCPGDTVEQLRMRKGGKLEVFEALHLILQALEGLGHLHEQGIMHSGLRPQSLLRTGQAGGVVKISDFGLARLFEEAGLSGLSVTAASANALHYTAREQLTDFKHAGPGTDVWSMGATLYSLLTGMPAREFRDGEDPIEVVLNSAPVPLRRRRPDVPIRVADAVDRALADAVADRWRSGAEFREALVKALK
jgi:tRNA A-37 threonylcarbamoyl transferase component Bud32